MILRHPLTNISPKKAFEQFGSDAEGVRQELPEVLSLDDSLDLFIRISVRFQVRVPWALRGQMPFLLATKTSSMLVFLDVLILLFLLLNLVLVFIFFGLVLRELAPWSLFAGLPTAPPHLSSKLRSMCAAAPVEIFLFKVFTATEFADFLIDIEVPSLFQFLDPLPHLIPFILEGLHLLVGLVELFVPLLGLHLEGLGLQIQRIHLLFQEGHQLFLVLLHLLHCPHHFLQIILILVPFDQRTLELRVDDLLVLVHHLDLISVLVQLELDLVRMLLAFPQERDRIVESLELVAHDVPFHAVEAVLVLELNDIVLQLLIVNLLLLVALTEHLPVLLIYQNETLQLGDLLPELVYLHMQSPPLVSDLAALALLLLDQRL
mmetsp:Transcript_25638/g.24936  ORF Transcript_25638/g.24936 Transcript_25638/m.24936 type:complete len:376 (-) Transcript_25638:989-2116(-)|eukprot:CAMPEP_0170555322 /NCGR_PEP_ID=MMETSP0211-20121228/13230_1 /TAXON_ID=311385 /ORGANISM="Pseudokeronopsis sp., Strain OXSARD2" /LENGTH=375 /DNA_ID=CAMNT_0010865099 /DNA_START=1225 /DNA_END=2352 /DNA_ORIENTATION=+